jgi:hypothetical protein
MADLEYPLLAVRALAVVQVQVQVQVLALVLAGLNHYHDYHLIPLLLVLPDIVHQLAPLLLRILRVLARNSTHPVQPVHLQDTPEGGNVVWLTPPPPSSADLGSVVLVPGVGSVKLSPAIGIVPLGRVPLGVGIVELGRGNIGQV